MLTLTQELVQVQSEAADAGICTNSTTNKTKQEHKTSI